VVFKDIVVSDERGALPNMGKENLPQRHREKRGCTEEVLIFSRERKNWSPSFFALAKNEKNPLCAFSVTLCVSVVNGNRNTSDESIY
jgi:hypothetical protein